MAKIGGEKSAKMAKMKRKWRRNAQARISAHRGARWRAAWRIRALATAWRIAAAHHASGKRAPLAAQRHARGAAKCGAPAAWVSPLSPTWPGLVRGGK